MNKNKTKRRDLLENLLSRKRAGIVDNLIPDNLRKGRILDIGCEKMAFFLINAKFSEKYGLDLEIS